mmetsp:Transcript_17760/g.49700  ORF Transcript_17760/g.49700 Transcript_17760/m.49700 type:complete len:205 (-) Transcript_17760:144-758(-)
MSSSASASPLLAWSRQSPSCFDRSCKWKRLPLCFATSSSSARRLSGRPAAEPLSRATSRSGSSHCRSLMRASSLLCASRSICSRYTLSTMPVYLLSALVLDSGTTEVKTSEPFPSERNSGVLLFTSCAPTMAGTMSGAGTLSRYTVLFCFSNLARLDMQSPSRSFRLSAMSWCNALASFLAPSIRRMACRDRRGGKGEEVAGMR